MGTLTVTYSRKDLFGNHVCAKDTKMDFGKDDLVKAFLLLSKHQDAKVQVDNLSIYWRDAADYDKKSVSVAAWSDNSLVGGQIPFARIKRVFYTKMKKCELA